MKISKTLVFLMLIALVGCSNGSKRDSGVSGESAEVEQPTDADFIVDAEDDSLISEGSTPVEEISAVSGPSSESPMEEVASVPSSPEISEVGTIAEYQVKKGDTLMLIAFNLFGDYRKWRELKTLNNLEGQSVSVGSTLKYYRPATEFSWRPDGLPYLIKMGDTLGTISKDKYGTVKKWRKIYDNNQPLIRDPNLIFSGFTIYYVPEERDVASFEE
ncbi:MAG: hypothetical protein Fur0010_07390 [Bdellovibrio sp.]